MGHIQAMFNPKADFERLEEILVNVSNLIVDFPHRLKAVGVYNSVASGRQE